MIRLLSAYPELLNLYGDHANMAMLQRRLQAAGQDVGIGALRPGEDWVLSGCNLLYIGAGTEGALRAALGDMESHVGELRSYIGFGGIVLCTGNAMALMGKSVTFADGETLPGAGLLDFSARVVAGRRYGELILETPLCPFPVIGALNTSLEYESNASPLFGVNYETNKGIAGATEGALRGRVLATGLCGPLLVRNPALLDIFAALLMGAPLPACGESWYREAMAGYTSALRTLRQAAGKERA